MNVVERRLRPIYDNLDVGYNKRAVQEADKVLKKQPTLLCAQALKGLALLRMGKEGECKLILDKVVKANTSDDATLQALTICFRELHIPEKICCIYETATKLEPNNDELLSHLFMSYVRIGDFKNQKGAGMQLYRLTNIKPYYYWTVMSGVMESTTSRDDATKRVTLQIASRMMDKFFSEGKIESAEEFMLYIFILELQNDSARIVEILEKPDIQKINQKINYVETTKATHLIKLYKLADAAKVYKDLISKQPDNWQHYENYIETVTQMYKSSDGSMSILHEAADYLKSMLTSSETEKSRDRSPWLGLIHLLLKATDLDLDESLCQYCGSAVDQIINYVKRFGDKMCCYGDIVNFLCLIKTPDIESLLQKVEELVDKTENGMPTTVRDLHRHQLWLQLCIALGNLDDFNGEQLIRWADRVLDFYSGTEIFSEGLQDTDIRPNDTYLIMAAQSYLNAFSLYIDGDKSLQNVDISSKIIHICSWMEYGLDISKANFQLKLLLIKLYNLIGSPAVSKKSYRKLELKHIQYDTLGYVIATQSMDLGLYSLTESIFASSLEFFMANNKETADSIVMAYKFGTLTRIPEFTQFQERLARSMQFALVSIENMFLAITQASTDMKDVIKYSDFELLMKKIQFPLIDNRDLNVMNNWLPKDRKLSSTQIEKTVEDEVLMIKFRFCVMKILYACSRVATKDDANVTGLKITDLVDEIGKLFNDCDKYRTKSKPKLPLQAPDVPRIYDYAKMDCGKCLLAHSQFLANITVAIANPEEFCTKNIGDSKKIMSSVLSSAKNSIEKLESAASKVTLCANRPHLTTISHSVQTISIACLFLSYGHSMLTSHKQQSKGKKKKGSSLINDGLSSLSSYITWLTKQLRELESLLKKKHTEAGVMAAENLVKKFSELTFDPEKNLPYEQVCASIESSFMETLSCITQTLSNKVKFLSTIKL